MNETLLSILSIVIVVAYIVVEKYVLPKISPADIQTAADIVSVAQKFSLVFDMAGKFVIQAKKMFDDGEGTQKREWVITQLKGLADKIDLVLSDEELLAINEDAYNQMKKAE